MRLERDTTTRRMRLTTTVELVRGDGVRLYNSRRVRRYTDAHDIHIILDTLVPEQLWVEGVVPMIGAAGKRYADLRVVTVAGEPTVAVVRANDAPFTNLHLLSQRTDASELWRRLPAARDRVTHVARAVARCYPRTLMTGADIAVTPGGDVVVIEVNAWGDLLRGVAYDGEDAYGLQARAIARGWPLIASEEAA
jgi:hypothetical protein